MLDSVRESQACFGHLSADTLSRVAASFFGVANPDLLAEEARVLPVVMLAAGQALFRQGDPGDSAYVLLAGKLQIVVEQPDGRAQLIDELEVGSTAD